MVTTSSLYPEIRDRNVSCNSQRSPAYRRSTRPVCSRFRETAMEFQGSRSDGIRGITLKPRPQGKHARRRELPRLFNFEGELVSGGITLVLYTLPGKVLGYAMILLRAAIRRIIRIIDPPRVNSPPLFFARYNLKKAADHCDPTRFFAAISRRNGRERLNDDASSGERKEC